MLNAFLPIIKLKYNVCTGRFATRTIFAHEIARERQSSFGQKCELNLDIKTFRTGIETLFLALREIEPRMLNAFLPIIFCFAKRWGDSTHMRRQNEKSTTKVVLFHFGELDENKVELFISSSKTLSSWPLVLYMILMWSS